MSASPQAILPSEIPSFPSPSDRFSQTVDPAMSSRLVDLELRLARARRAVHGARVYLDDGKLDRAAARLADVVQDLDALTEEARQLATVARCDAAVTPTDRIVADYLERVSL